MNNQLSILLLSSAILCTGCQSTKNITSKTTEKVKNMIGLGEPKVPKIDQQGIVDASKATLEKLEQMKINMPTGQWVYIENDLQGIYSLQNKNKDSNVLYFRLNCKIPSQKSGFSIEDKDGKELLKSNDPQFGQIQFLIDNKNFGNPFDLVNAKKMPAFKTTFAKAKVVKIFNNGKLYNFNNGHAELLEKSVTCKE